MIFCFLFIVSIVAMSAEILIDEDFSEGTLPDGWQTVGANAGANWSFPTTNIAGGANGEAFASQDPDFSADLIMKSNFVPNVDTPAFTLSFRQFYDAYGSDLWTAEVSVVLMSESAQMYTVWSNEDDLISDYGPMLNSCSFAHPFPEADSLMVRFIVGRATHSIAMFHGCAVDDVLLETSTDVSGTITSSMSPWSIDTNLTIPEGMTLTIEPGVEIRFAPSVNLTVNGHLQINGTEAEPVTFTAVETLLASMLDVTGTATINSLVVTDVQSNAQGSVFNVESSSSFVLTGCRFDRCESQGSGGVMYLDNCDVTISGCQFSNCNAAEHGGGICAISSTLSIVDTDFSTCTAENGSGGVLIVFDCTIEMSRVEAVGNESTSAGATLYATYSSGTLDRVLIAESGYGNDYSVVQISTGSSFVIKRCTFTECRENGYGILGFYESSNAVVNSCIFWNNFGDNIDLHSPDSSVEVKYCDIEGGQSSVQQGGTLTWGEGNINADPLFLSPEAGDYNLGRLSPALNMGDPSLSLDPDGSYVEMGCYHASYLCPLIDSVADVPGDQGRQVYVHWIRSSCGVTYNPDYSYSVWRKDTMPGRNAMIIHSPSGLPKVIEQPIVLMRDTEVWVFIAQVPCMGFDTYTIVAPTLMDSSSSGLNESTFMAYCHTDTDIHPSEPSSGYSTDNIAPDSPRGISITTAGTAVQIQWDEVTTGSFEGNAYQELNGVWYNIFAGNNPDFTCDQEHYLATTRHPWLLQSSGSEPMKYYKVVASDQE